MSTPRTDTTERHLQKPASAPCVSCPYRHDVPSGIWDRSEYEKLVLYDGPTWGQSPALFMCHQKDGSLCAGWLACHDTDHLLALRLHPVHESAYGYQSPVSVFGSGAEARSHGLAEIDTPGQSARRMMARLERKQTESVSNGQQHPNHPADEMPLSVSPDQHVGLNAAEQGGASDATIRGNVNNSLLPNRSRRRLVRLGRLGFVAVSEPTRVEQDAYRRAKARLVRSLWWRKRAFVTEQWRRP